MVRDTQTIKPEPVVHSEELGDLIRKKRHLERLTLEEAAKQIGVSAATLSRWERQRTSAGSGLGRASQMTDMRTLTAITRWLDVSLSHEVKETNEAEVPDVVEAYLRADRNLDPETAAALSRVFRAAYEQFAGQRKEGDGEENKGTG